MIKGNSDNVFGIASNNQCQGARSAVPLWPGGGGGTRIPRASTVRMTPPDAHHNTKEANIALSTYVEKWKNRYEEAERKHKAYLLKSEKAKREYDDLQRRFNIVSEERNHLDCELRERERELSRLKTVSEKLFTEYQQLKNQHEVDSGVMNKLMQQAGEWYKQNKQLKRRSTALLQALPAKGIDIDFTDSTDTASEASSNEEVEFLKSTVHELSGQVASLTTELGAARLQEFEAVEGNVALAQEVEALQSKCSSQESEVLELRRQLERLERMSGLLVGEVQALKENADRDREMAETYKTEARAAKKRVRELVHQSALLSSELEGEEGGGRLVALTDELHALSGALAEQRDRHQRQIHDLQLQLAEKHEETDILLWEEKIKLAEEDAQKAIERAERAEKRLAELERKLAETSMTKSATLPLENKPTLTPLTNDKPSDVKLTDVNPSNVILTDKSAEVKEDRLKAPKRSNLMSRISYFENGGEKKDEAVDEKVTEKTEVMSCSIEETEIEPAEEEMQEIKQVEEFKAPPPPPPPPCAPPPPPPPPPPFAPALGVGVGGLDMATMLANKQGTLKKCVQNGGGAIDAIVDQIKGGKFHLKCTDQNFASRKPKDEQPEAVKEMLAILGTLRKRRVVRHSVASDTSE